MASGFVTDRAIAQHCQLLRLIRVADLCTEPAGRAGVLEERDQNRSTGINVVEAAQRRVELPNIAASCEGEPPVCSASILR